MRTNICVPSMLKQILMFKIQVVKINILFEFGLKACKKRKGPNEDSGVTSQLQMAAVYIDYGLYASSDQIFSGTWSWIKTERRSHWKGSACIQMYMLRTSQNSSPMFDRRSARSTGVSVDRPAGPDLVLFSARLSCCRDKRASGTRIPVYRYDGVSLTSTVVRDFVTNEGLMDVYLYI